MRKTLIAAATAAAAGLMLPSAAAYADPPPWAPAHGKRAKDRYDRRGYYVEPVRLTRITSYNVCYTKLLRLTTTPVL